MQSNFAEKKYIPRNPSLTEKKRPCYTVHELQISGTTLHTVKLLFTAPLAPPLGELPQCAHWG